jgi:hypothetical protein
MGERGMADMGEMEMPLPDNTLPMMTGTGPFGPLEMGGMFTTLKVRRDQAHNDYRDPGWYTQPAGTRPFEWTGALPTTNRPIDPVATPAQSPALSVKKPSAGHKH